MTNDASLFNMEALQPSKNAVILADGNRVQAEGYGTITLPVTLDGKTVRINLQDVYLVPGLNANLMSLGTLERKGMKAEAVSGTMMLFDKNGYIAMRTT